jgi:recombination protein RecA
VGKKRQRKLDMAIATIHRRYGPKALGKGHAEASVGRSTAVPHIPTGFPKLDQALHIGGLPKGKLCEMLGPTTSGKTTLALKFLAQAQAGGGQVAYIDQALYFDPDYAHRCGLDLSRLLVSTTHDLQESLAITEALARSGSLSALILDILDFFWTDPGTVPSLAATLNRLPPFLARSGTTLLILHETGPGGVAPTKWKGPATSTSPALSALAHHAAVRLQISREDWLYRHDDIRGYKARVEIAKNKLGPAGKTVHISIKFNGTVRGDGL